MKLSEFVLQSRGAGGFDSYLHPQTIPTPLGEFSLEFQVKNAARRPPDEKMLAAIITLRQALESDLHALVTLVHEQYLLAAEDEEWCEVCELPTGLGADELAPLLEGQTISVAQQETDADEPHPGRVYISPQWDQEHGLYVARIDDRWVLVDC